MNRRRFIQTCVGVVAVAVIAPVISAQPAVIRPSPPLPNCGEAVPEPGDDYVQRPSGLWVTKGLKDVDFEAIERQKYLIEFYVYETWYRLAT